MANIWRKDDSHREKPNRNVLDLSFQNNLTLDFGYLYPVVCQPTIPGDSYEIKPTFALNFEPMVFPIQTRMRAHLHFFKVRNRTLWKDWEDFIGRNKQSLEVPYIDESVTKARTGSLLDYLGVPTTLSGRYGRTSSFDFVSSVGGYDYLTDITLDFGNNGSDNYTTTVSSLTDQLSSLVGTNFSVGRASSLMSDRCFVFRLDFEDNVPNDNVELIVKCNRPSGSSVSLGGEFPSTFNFNGTSYNYYSPTPRDSWYRGSLFRLIAVTDGVITAVYEPSNDVAGELVFKNINYDSNSIYYFSAPVMEEAKYRLTSATSNSLIEEYVNYTFYFSLLYNLDGVTDIDDSNSPYWRSSASSDLRERIKLRALRPRAYEAIYNSFYRNAENNPYKIDGVEEYNKYIPTVEGGLDSNLYQLRRRNWEDDFLTTALPMPQAGIAPLVGLTGTAGAATVTIANDQGETVVANAQVDEDGNITSLTTEASSNLASSLLDTVTYGISINDLRNVNAFQRWLEAKARGGYKYRDQIETLFGVTVRYDTLDMPEFIGGMSLDVFVSQVTQTVNVSPSSPLGDLAGQASCIGSGKSIREYCDEHGYIIGILSVVPVPNYSQLLDKDWFKTDAFDYFFPQFGHIGMQPITYKEVCPIQAYQESTETDNVLEDTFGYQRAWYDYLARTDEVHGHFRTTLRDFVMNRTFDVKPELSESFLLVDNDQLNDVFAITDNSVPKIRGQIYFDLKAKRPIPLYGIPKLE